MKVRKSRVREAGDLFVTLLIIVLLLSAVAIYAVSWRSGGEQLLDWLGAAYAQESSSASEASDLGSKIREYQQKVEELRKEKNTLSSQIQYMDTQISLTDFKIRDTQQKIILIKAEIDTLSERISSMNSSLDRLAKNLIGSIASSYKARGVSVFEIIFDSNNINELVNNMKYLKTVRQNSQNLLVQVQQAKLNYEEQKKLREQKTIELAELSKSLEIQQQDLDLQKAAKQKLLLETDSDEQKYQILLSKAQAEYAAIQGIVTAGGNEVDLGAVKKGDFIASIIPGPSCNSGGAHTHFIVKDNGVVSNPFNYLKPVSISNCSGSSCNSSDGDPANPSGSLDWPLQPSIELEQGYGTTWAVRNTWVGRIYNFHNGIDINGAGNDITAIADGSLFKGSYSGTNGCALPYVKLVHKDSPLVTYYLHVYPK